MWVPIVNIGVAASGEGVTGESKSLVLLFDTSGKVTSRSTSLMPIGSPTKRTPPNSQSVNPEF
jgi:hypothetical protein